MIQFNLLPDVKLQYVKANRIKHLAVVVSTVTASILLAITLILVFSVKVVQAKHITSLSNQISSTTTSIKNTPNLAQILTIQNQLSALTALHNQKPVASRIPTYLAELTPASATISKVAIDFSANTIQISGTADSLATVDQFVDTLKFSTYSTSPNSGNTKAFSSVVLAEFGYTTATGATYEITANFDPAIFSNTSNVTLTVPTLITTRSELDQPTTLFKPQPTSGTSPSSSTSSSLSTNSNSSGQ